MNNEEKIFGTNENSTKIENVKNKARDTYSNLLANLGLGANNISESARYIMTRFTWDYQTLNTLYRNNWIAKAIIDKPNNEMIKNGFEIQSQIEQEKITKIMSAYKRTKTNSRILEALKWSSLYGGALFVPLIEGQEDLSEPLDYDTIDIDSYKGGFVVDRWSGVSPSLELEEDITSPDFGLPKYYIVTDNTTNKTYTVHGSRVIRFVGRELPYIEQLSETYWGASELEHIYTELKKRDDTSANISYLIFLANVRVLKYENLSQLIGLGDQEAVAQVYGTLQEINRLMSNTGIFVTDPENTFETHQYSFTGINDVYESFMLDISGAAEIPCDKLFGRSPNGFNSGDMVLQAYYDNIQEKQESRLRQQLEKIIKIISMSSIGLIPEDIEIMFNPIRQSDDTNRATLAAQLSQPLFDAFDRGLINKTIVLRELKAQQKLTGLWSNISDEYIAQTIEEEEKEKEEERNTEIEMQNKLKEIAEQNKIKEE